MSNFQKPQGYQREQTRRMTQLAILAAIAIILNFIQGIPIIPPIYKLDFSTLPVWIAALLLGPFEGVVVAFIKALSGLFHSSSMGVGELADFLCACSLTLVSAYIYRARDGKFDRMLTLWGNSIAKFVSRVLKKVKHTAKTANAWTETLFILISTVAGILALIIVGAVANYYILIPFYVNLSTYKMTEDQIVGLISKTVPSVNSLPKLIMYATVPFNLLKGAILAFLTWPIHAQLKKYIKK